MFLLLGLWTGYGPLHHYIHGGVDQACPWAPVHGHVILLGWLGLTVFGLVYRALPEWGSLPPWGERAIRVQLWISVVAISGVLVNGIFGYRLLDHLYPEFFYRPETPTLRWWLAVDGAFLSLFALGCGIFVIVLFASTWGSRARS